MSSDRLDAMMKSNLGRAAQAIRHHDGAVGFAAINEQRASQLRDVFAELGIDLRHNADFTVIAAVLGSTSIVVENVLDALLQIPEDASLDAIRSHIFRVCCETTAALMTASGVEIHVVPANTDVQAFTAERLRLARRELGDIDPDSDGGGS